MRVKLIDITGKAISGEWGTDDTDGTGIPVLRTTNFTNNGTVNYSEVATRQIKKKNIQDKFLKYGDIIIEKSGGSDKQPVGRVIFFEGENNKFLFNNFTGLLRVKNTERWMPKYVFYALFANYLAGGTRPYENRTTGLHNLQTDTYVAKTEISSIPYSDQQQIVAILDKICALIDKSRQQLAKLDELVKARFVEMFGDPMTNPKALPVVKFGTVLTVEPQNGLYKPQSSYVVDGTGTPILRIDGFYNGKVTDFQSLKRLKCTDADVERYRLAENDIVINRVNSLEYLGKCGLVRGLVEDTVFESNMMRLHIDETKLNPVYITQLLCSKYIYRQILTMAKKAVNQASINQKDVQSFMVYMPPMELQNQFAAFVQATNQSKSTIQASIDRLETLKKSLMQEYFG